MVKEKVKKILRETLPAETLKHPELLDAAGETIFREIVEPEIQDGIAIAVARAMPQIREEVTREVLEEIKKQLEAGSAANRA